LYRYAAAHREGGFVFSVPRPDELPGEPGEVFSVKIRFATPVVWGGRYIPVESKRFNVKKRSLTLTLHEI
jgi:hypothetical protein